MNLTVIDTNILLIANDKHEDISSECRGNCVERLKEIKASGIVVIDDEYRILREYLNKTAPNQPKGMGDTFLKWLLQNIANTNRVHQVAITEINVDEFSDFPDSNLQQQFDPPDRKFVAVSAAHPNKPPIWQAADCKWLTFIEPLKQHEIQIDLLCPKDTVRFFENKFPDQELPEFFVNVE